MTKPQPTAYEEEDTEKIARLEKEVLRLRSKLQTDSLTRVLNRQALEDSIQLLFDEAQFARNHEGGRRLDFTDLAIVFVDLDNFKKINDTYGHEAGDKVLEAASALFAQSIRGIDRVGRYGGEEFVIVLTGATEAQGVQRAEAIRKKLSGLIFEGKDMPEKITGSFGVASLGETNAPTAHALVEAADKAMYEAKTGRGKNAVVAFGEIVNQ